MAQGYDATVEELLHPESQPALDEDILYRYFPNLKGPLAPVQAQTNWVYRMINTPRPLEEKMALFWHHLFATGNSKIDNPPECCNRSPCSAATAWAASATSWLTRQDPAMIFWLDNNGNHAAPSTRTRAGSCWSCSRWAWATTARTISRRPPALSPAGPLPEAPTPAPGPFLLELCVQTRRPRRRREDLPRPTGAL